MITINSVPATFESLMFPFPTSSLQADILKQKLTATTTYNYNTKDELLFELNLRTATINSSALLYKGRMAFAIFRKAKANPKYWTVTENGAWKLIGGVSSADAINDIFENGSLYATECATAMVIVYYKALLTVIGAEKFSRSFLDITLMNWSYIDKRLREVGMLQKSTDFFAGDRRYFKNPDVDPETPEWQGENTIDMSKDMYYGHGIGIHNADFIITTLNSTRKEGSTTSAFLMDSVGRPNYNSLYREFMS